MGQLFGPNAERGVFKTTDGGGTWDRVLHVDEDTGVTDIVMDPSNPDILYAATYQRRRTRWGLNGGGPGSGIWKTDDGGARWARLTGILTSFPIIALATMSIQFFMKASSSSASMGVGG